MNVIKTSIPSVLIFEPKVFGDERGYFLETFRQSIIDEYMPGTVFLQGNESSSSYGVLRGLHFQHPPHAQGKLVRVVMGEVLDVAVDIRLGSPTYGQHVAVKLSGENKRQLWIPRGFAHGFVVLSQQACLSGRQAIFSYQCDNYYNPASDGGIRFDDPALNIDWLIPHKDIRVSDKDNNLPLLSEVDSFQYEEMVKA